MSWLAMRRAIWTWPVQLAGALLLFAASASQYRRTAAARTENLEGVST